MPPASRIVHAKSLKTQIRECFCLFMSQNPELKDLRAWFVKTDVPARDRMAKWFSKTCSSSRLSGEKLRFFLVGMNLESDLDPLFLRSRF